MTAYDTKTLDLEKEESNPLKPSQETGLNAKEAAQDFSEENPIEILCHSLEQENADLKERLLRSFSDQENQKKRFEQEIQRVSRKTLVQLIEDLLPIVDNFERALASAIDLPFSTESSKDLSQENLKINNLMQGVHLIQKEILSVLQRFGVHKLEALGHFFDPACHQAMGHIEHDSYDTGTVAQILQEGYKMIHDKNHHMVIRPASVLLAKKPESISGMASES